MTRDDDQKRRDFEAYFNGLSTDERRNQIYLRAEFRDAYNEITQAHRIFVLPQYYFRHWRHVLGPVAHTLYEEMRRRTFYNAQTGERRDTFYATQDELALTIGVKDRKTIRKALRVLGEHGFIARAFRHYKDPKTGRPYRGADEITVYFEIPLTTSDAVELLLKTTVNTDDSVLRKKSPLQHRDPESQRVKRIFSPLRAEEKIPSNVSTPMGTKLSNVREKPLKGEPRKQLPVFDLNPEQREARDRRAYNLLRDLHRYAGNRDEPPLDHKDMGYFRRIATLLPEALINKALSAARDATLDKRNTKSIYHYFHGAVLNVAKEAGIDLGFKSEVKRAVEAN